MRGKTLHLVFLTFLLLLAQGSLSAGTLFKPVQTYDAGGNLATSIAVGDVNGDGKPDLLVANLCGGNCAYADGSAAVLLGNGDGTFQTASTYYSGGAYAQSIAVGDVNGDGKPDLVVANQCSTKQGNCDPDSIGVIGVLLGNGDGTFVLAATYSSGGWYAGSIAVEDVNGDGKSDLLVVNERPGVGVLLGNGDGTFRAAQIYSFNDNYAYSIAVGDVNGDHTPDLLVTTISGFVAVLLGNGDGTFRSAVSYPSGNVPVSIALADVNGDGQLDAVVTNNCFADNCAVGGVGVLMGNGDGTFNAPQRYSSLSRTPQSIAVADVSGDGKLDALVANLNGVAGVLLGNGDGSFQAAQKYLLGGQTRWITVADVNGDAKPDLLVALAVPGAGVLLGTARFNSTTSLTSSLNPSVYGQAVTLTATVTSIGPITPTGNVTFKNGTTSAGMAALSGGVALRMTTKLPAGTLSITARYNGDSNSAKSTSAVLTQVVNPASTTTTITSSVNPSVEGQPVTFTAKVISPTAKPVTGAVTFTAGTTTLGTVLLSGGKAGITTSALPPGNNTITATYEGTPNILGSAAALIQIVN